MARKSQNVLGKLADAGEEAISKVGEIPGLSRLPQALDTLRDRMDDLQKRVRGLEAVEQRLVALEKRVDELASAKPKTTRSRSASGTRRTTARKSPRKSSSE